MTVNQSALLGIFTAFNTLFNKVFKASEPRWSKYATRVPSQTGEESYKWLGTIPKMREWIGDKQIQNLSAFEYLIKNKDFELTVAVDRNDIEDDRIGLYTPQIEMLAQSAAAFPDDMVFEVIRGAFKNKCFDGKTFYAADHKVGKNTVSNLTNAALTPESYKAARSAMMGFRDEHGNSLNLVPNILVVPPALESMGRRILLADQIDGTTNTYKGTATLEVEPALAGADTQWHLLDTKMPIKPFIFQDRKPVKFVSLDKDTDHNVFMQKKFIYGAEARGNSGYGFWQMAYGSTGEA